MRVLNEGISQVTGAQKTGSLGGVSSLLEVVFLGSPMHPRWGNSPTGAVARQIACQHPVEAETRHSGWLLISPDVVGRSSWPKYDTVHRVRLVGTRPLM